VERLAAISVDLDEIPCYAAIHGLDAPGDAAHAIYDRAIPRLERMFADEGVPVTFFAIGSDLAREANATALRRLVVAGHEIANHSLSHFYDLTRRDPATLRAEVGGGIEAIERAAGVRPVGFRAPGYTITDDLFDVLAELGVEYDSSVFPCPPYYAAKAVAMAVIAARGRESRSVLDDPRVLRAPADPYRVGRPYWSRGDGVLEIPIGVTRGARLPYIGTSVALAGERGARVLTRMIAGRPLVSLELHGIDLADAEADDLSFLQPHQPDLRKTAAEKERALRAAIDELRARGYAFALLRDAARQWAAPSR
jgi:peptidoglycan/xylan/chitin deacetylase (PgdA/CDA1 family)